MGSWVVWVWVLLIVDLFSTKVLFLVMCWVLGGNCVVGRINCGVVGLFKIESGTLMVSLGYRSFCVYLVMLFALVVLPVGFCVIVSV